MLCQSYQFTGLPEYNQRLEDDEVENNKGDKLMSSQLIAMQIVARDSDPKDDLILYTNPFLNCDDGCRPLK